MAWLWDCWTVWKKYNVGQLSVTDLYTQNRWLPLIRRVLRHLGGHAAMCNFGIDELRQQPAEILRRWRKRENVVPTFPTNLYSSLQLFMQETLRCSVLNGEVLASSILIEVWGKQCAIFQQDQYLRRLPFASPAAYLKDI